MAKNKKMVTSEFYCTRCGKKGIPIARANGSQREAGHLKRLFCLNCQEEINHAEIRPFGNYRLEDFELEFELGRFMPDGTKIPVKDLMGCSKGNCEYNIHGRCWNSNGSYKCGHKHIMMNPNDETKHLLNRGW